MSKYIPANFVNQEIFMQHKRREYGLQTGEYVKYPDAEKGPYIIKASLAERLRAEMAEKVVEENASLLEKLKD